jgi:hypothetical protein
VGFGGEQVAAEGSDGDGGEDSDPGGKKSDPASKRNESGIIVSSVGGALRGLHRKSVRKNEWRPEGTGELFAATRHFRAGLSHAALRRLERG